MGFWKKASASDAYIPPKEYYKDPLFPAAVEVTLSCRVVSAGRLQSALRIGAIRATSLLSELEDHGIIGPDSGNRPREIFYTMEQWEKDRSNFIFKPVPQKQTEPSPPPTSGNKAYCPYCHSRVPRGAVFCWRCARKLPGKVDTGYALFCCLIIPIILFLILFSFVDLSYSDPAPVISKSEYIENCRTISYEKLSRNPDSYDGEYFTFVGEVIQVMESGSRVHFRMNITEYEVGGTYFSKDPIYVTTRLGEDGARILENDIIRIYGQCDGLYTYTAVLGNSVSLPKIDAKYWEIIK